jgi:hypothetical protein
MAPRQIWINSAPTTTPHRFVVLSSDIDCSLTRQGIHRTWKSTAAKNSNSHRRFGHFGAAILAMVGQCRQRRCELVLRIGKRGASVFLANFVILSAAKNRATSGIRPRVFAAISSHRSRPDFSRGPRETTPGTGSPAGRCSARQSRSCCSGPRRNDAGGRRSERSRDRTPGRGFRS